MKIKHLWFNTTDAWCPVQAPLWLAIKNVNQAVRWVSAVNKRYLKMFIDHSSGKVFVYSREEYATSFWRVGAYIVTVFEPMISI